jgi:hypothetical protein
MRSLVGLADPPAYDNPAGVLMYPRFPPEAYQAVFGCGCGRAHSVFTHLIQGQTEHYLHEVARIRRPDGFFRSTWLFFERPISRSCRSG